MLLGLPSLLIGLYGAVGVITGKKLVAGALGALWGYAVVVGAYELNRRKFNWAQGHKHRDQNLLAGTLAVSVGLIVSGALNETMPALALVPALSAVKQASDGHDSRALTYVHAGVLLIGIAIGLWFYRNGVIGGILLEHIAALP